MNRCAYQQTTMVGCVGIGDLRRGDEISVVCPKPRRVGLFNNSHESIRPPRILHINNQQSEGCDLKAGTELLDFILTEGSYDFETPNFEMGSSPPFFFGSPPSRSSNPLIQDAQFGNDNFGSLLAIPEAAAAVPPPTTTTASTGRKNGGGCAPPAAVRIEGFNCRSSISAVA